MASVSEVCALLNRPRQTVIKWTSDFAGLLSGPAGPDFAQYGSERDFSDRDITILRLVDRERRRSKTIRQDEIYRRVEDQLNNASDGVAIVETLDVPTPQEAAEITILEQRIHSLGLTVQTLQQENSRLANLVEAYEKRERDFISIQRSLGVAEGRIQELESQLAKVEDPDSGLEAALRQRIEELAGEVAVLRHQLNTSSGTPSET